MLNNLSGYILVDKPVGPTSFKVVIDIRGALRPIAVKGQKRPWLKVGHTGTLDPLASGLLIIAVGSATKHVSQFNDLPKIYETTIVLGATTATDDSEAMPEPFAVKSIPDLETITKTLQTFVGEQIQIPPVFSAKKIDGKRAYALARQGKTVAPKPHLIEIYNIELLSYAYPKLDIRVTASTGTYIRSLARDIGMALQTGGYVLNLRRTQIGRFSTKEAITNWNDKQILLKNLQLSLAVSNEFVSN